MPNKPPAFQLYAADFYMDTSHWTTGQVGAYFRLLMYEWVNGGIPTKMSALARIAGVDVRNMHKMWSAEIAKKFTPDGAEMYVNLRLEETRLKQLNYQERQAEKGRKSAEIRAKLHPTVVEPALQPEVNSSSSSSSLKKEKNINIPYEEIISYLNQKSGKNFSSTTSSHRSLIKNRWNNFPDISFFKKVIDLKVSAWGHNLDMVKFLRPETLFGNKFDSYLNEDGTPRPKTLHELVEGFEKEKKTMKQIIAEEGL